LGPRFPARFQLDAVESGREDQPSFRLRTFQEILANTLPGGFQIFRQDARLTHYGHEIGVPGPARKHMQMQVSGNSGSGGFAQIQAHVYPAGTIDAPEDGFEALRGVHDFMGDGGGQSSQRAFVRVGQHHDVSRGIGIAIEDDEGARIAMDDERGLLGLHTGHAVGLGVFDSGYKVAEDAAVVARPRG